MHKIPTLFVRDSRDMKRVLPEINPACAWVLNGEGVATRKYDGTCVMIDAEGAGWARREVKPGKTAPPGWVEVDHDQVTGKRVGWEPIGQSSFAKYYEEAVEPMAEFGALIGQPLPSGTYELVGPKINGNPERAEVHRLEPHANAEQFAFDGPWQPASAGEALEDLRVLVGDLAADGWEGIVWHHPDGRMAKLKARDFVHGGR